MALINVVPQISFADESVAIKVRNLHKRQKVALLSRQVNDIGKEFHSYAFYESNEDGVVDLHTDASSGGFYTGVQPMGLFRTLRRKGFSTLVSTSTNKPDEITIFVLDGHQDIGMDLSSANIVALTSTKLQRMYLDSNIDRIPIDTGDVRGVLFLPRNRRVVPGVIEIGGLNGGVSEGKAALIARKGFAVLGLSLFGLPGQPKHLSVIDLEVVEKAIDFLQSQEGVSKKSGVGIIGLSIGGSIVLAAAACIRKITCAINIAGPVFTCGGADIQYKDHTWKQILPDMRRMRVKDGVQYIREAIVDCPPMHDIHNHMPDFHKSKASILFQYGGDDNVLKVHDHVARAEEMFHSAGKLNYKIKVYDGAGHVLFTPNKPHIEAMFMSAHHAYPSYMGGTNEKHAKAQEDAWKDMIEFLTVHLYPTVTSHL